MKVKWSYQIDMLQQMPGIRAEKLILPQSELNILNGLKFKSSYGTDLAFWGSDGYTFQYFLANQGKDITQSSVNSDMHRGFNWQIENTEYSY